MDLEMRSKKTKSRNQLQCNFLVSFHCHKHFERKCNLTFCKNLSLSLVWLAKLVFSLKRKQKFEGFQIFFFQEMLGQVLGVLNTRCEDMLTFFLNNSEMNQIILL